MKGEGREGRDRETHLGVALCAVQARDKHLGVGMVPEEGRDLVGDLPGQLLLRRARRIGDRLARARHLGAEPVLAHDADGHGGEVELKLLELLLLVRTAGLERPDALEARLGLVRELGRAPRVLARDGNDAADPLGDAALLDDDKVLDLARLLDVGPAAELDTGRAPLWVLEVGRDLVERVRERDDPHRVRVRLAKDGPEAGDLLRRREVHLGAEDLDVALDPVVALGLDLGQVGRRDGRLVRKVEAQLGRRDERALLVNVVAEDLAQAEVEDVRPRVVVAQRPAAELVGAGVSSQRDNTSRERRHGARNAPRRRTRRRCRRP